jgi:hypothetical protein
LTTLILRMSQSHNFSPILRPSCARSPQSRSVRTVRAVRMAHRSGGGSARKSESLSKIFIN